MEYHLFLIWEKAQWKKADIISDISSGLEIIKTVDISWNKKNFPRNLSRFYGQNLPSNSLKEQECGNGTFTLLFVRDNAPDYQLRPTSHGQESVNVNIFDRKEKFRSWTNDETTPKNYHGSRIHGTNNEKETRHDLTCLLGISPEDLAADPDRIPDTWSENTIGLDGWKSLDELFYVMRQSVDFVVMRNYEYLPDKFRSELHGDIDLLVDSKKDAVWVLGGKPVFKSRFRVHYYVKVGNEMVYFDIRYAGDNYYCRKWEEHILSNRKDSGKGFCIMEDEDFRYSLLYHALIHKFEMADDYKTKLAELFPGQSPDTYNKILKEYMDKNGYTITYPKDLSVYWNKRNSGKRFQISRKLYSFICRADNKFFKGRIKL